VRYRRTVMRSAHRPCAWLGWIGLLASMVAGCAGSDDCPNDLPDAADCATAAPSYAHEVSGVLEEYCEVCHLPGNRFSTKVFPDYDHIFASRRTMLGQIYGCRMPVGHRQLSPRNRALLLKWFVCGAPNN